MVDPFFGARLVAVFWVWAGLVGLVVAPTGAPELDLSWRQPIRLGQAPEASAFAGRLPLPRGLRWRAAPVWGVASASALVPAQRRMA